MYRRAHRRVAWMVAGLSFGAVPAADGYIHANRSGFPVTVSGAGQVQGHPLIVDLGLSADGSKSIVFATTKGKLHVIYKNGSGNWVQAPGFPVDVDGTGSDVPIYSSPAVGDLDSPPDGVPEIVVGFGSHLTGVGGGVRAFRRNGASLWPANTVNSLDAIAPAGPDPVFSTPAIGDIDGDGDNEVVWGGLDFYLHAVRGNNGSYLTNWPLFIRDTVWSAAALHDIDGDGIKDVVIGVDAHEEDVYGVLTPNGGCVHALRFDASQTKVIPGDPATWSFPTSIAGFPVCVGQIIQNSVVIGDIDGDGLPEIVHGTGRYWGEAGVTPSVTPPEKVYAWNCDGSPVWGTAGNPGHAIQGQASSGAPALADLDGDGILDVVISADDTRSSSTHHVYGIRGTGTELFAPLVPKDLFNATLSAGPPIVADVLGANSDPEILVPTNGSVAVFSKTGALLSANNNPDAEPAFYTETSLTGVAVGELDNPSDGKIDMVAVSSDFATGNNVVVQVWNPISRSSTPPWGQFRHSPDRTGIAPGTAGCGGLDPDCIPPATATEFTPITPCRAFDSRGPLGTLPPFQNNEARTIALRSACPAVPLGAIAAAVNLTVTSPTRSGAVALHMGDCSQATLGSIAFAAGQTRANNAVMALSLDGNCELTAKALLGGTGSVHVIVDVNGYFAPITP